MRFTTARLCGGKSLMAVAADPMDIDMKDASDILSKDGFELIHLDDMMAIFRWNDMEVTLYPQGKVMFMPLEDKQTCISYATEILGKINGRGSPDGSGIPSRRGHNHIGNPVVRGA